MTNTRENVDKLFEDNLELVNYKLKKQYINYYNGNYSELEQDLTIILWKACQGWFKNKIYLRGTDGHKYKTATKFSYHYYSYVRGYMAQYKKANDLEKEKQNKYFEHIMTGESYYELTDILGDCENNNIYI